MEISDVQLIFMGEKWRERNETRIAMKTTPDYEKVLLSLEKDNLKTFFWFFSKQFW
jgi:hypothetical protein